VIFLPLELISPPVLISLVAVPQCSQVKAIIINSLKKGTLTMHIRLNPSLKQQWQVVGKEKDSPFKSSFSESGLLKSRRVL
jgi:hypothetical protein